MRAAVLWTGLSGYLNACLKELASRDGVELFVSHQASVQEAPFDDDQFAWIPNRLVWRSDVDVASLRDRLRAFDPEILVFCGWHVAGYRRVTRELAKRCFRVMAMDNCWNATPKQRLGTLIAPWYIRPIADAAWVPGSLSCDRAAIETVHESRLAAGRALPHSFLFLGRFVSDKGVDQLVKAYQLYRESSTDPWPLVCCGAGPLGSRLEGQPGIRIEGFVQPDRLRDLLASSGCLVLPSTLEPWGLVINEATTAGLVILASEKAGAAVHLVQDNYNGYIFDGGDVNELAALMSYVSSLSEERLDAMSRASYLLSLQFSPARWADTLLDGFHAFSRH